jgi:hypothetical protein
MNRKWFWSAEDDALVRREYPSRPTVEVAALLGRPVGCVNGRASRLGLRKDPEYRREVFAACGRAIARHPKAIANRIQKGNVPLNKGLRRPGYSIGRGRMRVTQFKKGQVSRNTLPIGTILLRSDGYLWKKVRDGVWNAREGMAWREVHRLVWIEAHGPIPRGFVVAFKDGNRQNVALDNLQLLPMADNMRRNSIHVRRSPEVKAAIYALITLKRSITMRGKRNGKK